MFMPPDFIPDDVAQFIISKIESVAQLEALLLLRSNPQKKWTNEALAERLYVNPTQTIEILTRLRAEGLVAMESGNPQLYRYEASSSELQEIVGRIAEIYSKHLVPVTNLIHSKPKSRVQEFADAFKIRKDY